MEMKYKDVILISMALLRSFVLSLKELVWAIAGIVLLDMLLLNYLAENYPITISDNFLDITQILTQHIVLFFVVFWIYFSYFEVKDYLKSTVSTSSDKEEEE